MALDKARVSRPGSARRSVVTARRTATGSAYAPAIVEQRFRHLIDMGELRDSERLAILPARDRTGAAQSLRQVRARGTTVQGGRTDARGPLGQDSSGCPAGLEFARATFAPPPPRVHRADRCLCAQMPRVLGMAGFRRNPLFAGCAAKPRRLTMVAPDCLDGRLARHSAFRLSASVGPAARSALKGVGTDARGPATCSPRQPRACGSARLMHGNA